MIERLNQISLSDFIELSCGNYNCLLSDSESVSDDELKKIASKLITDYRNISNPTAMKALIIEKEDLVKEQSKLLSLRICQTLISINCYEDVRDILALLDIDIRRMNNEQLQSKIDYMIHSALFMLKRNNEIRQEEYKVTKSTPEEIRSSFDSEIAFLMTFFKMNIDVYKTNAAVYANIVHQADIEISLKRRST